MRKRRRWSQTRKGSLAPVYVFYDPRKMKKMVYRSMMWSQILMRGHRHNNETEAPAAPESHVVLRTHRPSTWPPQWGYAVCTWSRPKC